MSERKTIRQRLLLFLAVLGPGLITAFADNDAGGVATYSLSAAKFGYGILATLIPITIVLIVTQEIGSRIAVVTGKGLADLIRERFGILTSLIIFGMLFFVNFGVILQDIGGLKDALGLFHLNYFIFLPIVIGLLFLLMITAGFKDIEKFFLFLILFYVAYLISAILSKPDWGLVAHSLIVPPMHITTAYLATAIAVLGTTVTPWGQFFINSYVKDKKLTPETLGYSQSEVALSAILTNVFSLLMMVAVIATIFTHGIMIQGASDAALAIRPLAGHLASLLFGGGLLVAGLLGVAIVPLATAYAFAEFFGFEGSLDVDYSKSKLFYGFFIFQIVCGTLAVFSPHLSLFRITLYADFLNGIFLPVIFYFLFRFANDPDIMGPYRNNRLQNFFLVSSGVVITIAALVGGIGQFIQ